MAVDTVGRCIGHCDVALSPEGTAAIARTAAWLPERPDRIIASDLARARNSAQVLAEQWGLEVAYDRRLREMHFGEWEGLAWNDLERDDSERLSAWMNDWVRVRAPGGESFEDVVLRAQEWFDEAQSTWAGESVVVVAHAGSIRGVLCNWLGMPLEWAFRLRVELAGVSVLRTM